LAEQRSAKITELEEQYAGYEVYDRDGEKIGKVDDLFVDEDDQPEYIGVRTGFLGTRSILVPMEAIRVDQRRRVVEVSQPKSRVKEGPTFNDDEEVTPEYEERVRKHYGLNDRRGSAHRGAYGSNYYTDRGWARDGHRERSESRRDTTTGSTSRRRGSNLVDGDELRVQRAEEELRVGTRKREAGEMRVRKRVHTDRERIRVPKRREEVSVERVQVEGREAAEAEIGEDEFLVPVTEEEVVVEKRPVVKEEIRVRKDVVEDEETVERDVRKEVVDIDDRTERGGRRSERPEGRAPRQNRRGTR
jgi:uncharacterized protein (TIGR02271 family)